MIKLCSVSLVLGGQTDPNLWYALLQDVNSNFYIWLNLSCLTKIQEHEMPNIINIVILDLAKFSRSKTALDSVLRPQFI
jgi:hypothetical protein